MNNYTWIGEVRAHEIDVQGIVNNTHYLGYFDHVRTLHFKELGINWAQLSHEGLNFVLINTNIRFLHSLGPFESFKVNSILARDGRLRLIFNQTITNFHDQLICTGINTVVCVDSKRNKPVSIDKYIDLRVHP